jgi:hypothetical protein
MKIRFLVIMAMVLFIASCAPLADKVAGTYTGQYTYNASVYYNITSVVAKENDNTVSIAFSGAGISNLNVSGVSVAASGDNQALSKAVTGESLSGTVQTNQLNVSYSYSGGPVGFIGTK